ncbi:MAG: hypothetical protein B7C55_12295 [Actinomycetales bacterium mxb001]|nr:MAG: hypothetical protein B7C55_12295 [Actinomycetales bacterium mxb001]
MSAHSPRLVLLVEDHPMVRTLVERSLEADGFEVASYATSKQAIKEFHGLDPDVLVADIDLGERPNGLELATLLRAQAPYLGVVFLSNYPSLDNVEGPTPAPPGSSFIHKSMVDGPDVLRSAIETALDDTRDPLIVGLPDDRPLAHLSAPQLNMLRYLAEGWSNAEISERRGITQRATERLVSRTFHALGIADDPTVNPRVVATRLYIQNFGVPEPGGASSS